MGIDNIHMLHEPQPDPVGDRIQRIQAAQEEELMIEHRRGKHTWGSMRRDCPLCQLDKE